MNVSTLLGVSGGVITVGGLAVVVISGLRRQNTQEQSNIITVQQNEIKAYKDSNDRLLQNEAALTAQVDTLKKNVQDFKDIAQQTPEIKKLIKEMAGSRVLLMKVITHLGIKNEE